MFKPSYFFYLTLIFTHFIKKEDLLSDEFLKQFKTGENFIFLAQIQKRGLEKMLESELDAHLGFDKHEKNQKQSTKQSI